MNMTPNGLGTEAWSQKTPGIWTEDAEAWWQGALSKAWRRRCQGPTCIREQVNNWSRSVGERNRSKPSQNGPRPVGPGQPAWPISGPVHDALWPWSSSIYCLCLRRPPHPSNHQRAADTKEKNREEADGRRKSLSCLGDGLGHALASMAGPAWWSHSGVPEPQVVCTFNIRWCNHILSYFDLLQVVLIHMCSYHMLLVGLDRIMVISLVLRIHRSSART
jgi:hypothetical protein